MKYLVVLFISITIFFACTTPREELKKGHYRYAVQLAISELRKGKNVKENEFILKT